MDSLDVEIARLMQQDSGGTAPTQPPKKGARKGKKPPANLAELMGPPSPYEGAEDELDIMIRQKELDDNQVSTQFREADESPGAGFMSRLAAAAKFGQQGKEAYVKESLGDTVKGPDETLYYRPKEDPSKLVRFDEKGYDHGDIAEYLPAAGIALGAGAMGALAAPGAATMAALGAGGVLGNVLKQGVGIALPGEETASGWSRLGEAGLEGVAGVVPGALGYAARGIKAAATTAIKTPLRKLFSKGALEEAAALESQGLKLTAGQISNSPTVIAAEDVVRKSPATRAMAKQQGIEQMRGLGKVAEGNLAKVRPTTDIPKEYVETTMKFVDEVFTGKKSATQIKEVMTRAAAESPEVAQHMKAEVFARVVSDSTTKKGLTGPGKLMQRIKRNSAAFDAVFDGDPKGRLAVKETARAAELVYRRYANKGKAPGLVENDLMNMLSKGAKLGGVAAIATGNVGAGAAMLVGGAVKDRIKLFGIKMMSKLLLHVDAAKAYKVLYETTAKPAKLKTKRGRDALGNAAKTLILHMGNLHQFEQDEDQE